MIAWPASEISVPDDVPAFYLWLLVPLSVGGVAATLAEARDTVHCLMDEHGDAQGAAVFKVHMVPDWPYARLVPDAGFTRGTHEWMKANIERAQRRKAERNVRRRARAIDNDNDEAPSF